MTTATLVERYLDTWNETDARSRRAAVAALFREDGSYVDPLASVSGHEQIAALIGAVQEQMPGHVFRLAEGSVDTHHNVARFKWELVPETGGDPLAIGFDVAVTSDDGRIDSVVGFLDKAPAA
jgi:ketosteroid isomerase-like protein